MKALHFVFINVQNGFFISNQTTFFYNKLFNDTSDFKFFENVF